MASSKLSKDISYKRLEGCFSKLKRESENIRSLIYQGNNIKEPYKHFLTLYEKFIDLNTEYTQSLTKSEKNQHQSEYINWDVYLQNFKREAENWFSESVKERTPTPKRPHSIKSSLSSLFLREMHGRIESNAENEAKLKREHLRRELKEKEERIDLETRLKIAEERVRLYEEQTNSQECSSNSGEDILELNPEANTYVPPNQKSQVTDPIQNLANILTLRMDRDALPKPEPDVYKGDPLKFPLWMNSFERFIEQRTDDPTERLFYLGRYTDGEVKGAISGLLGINTADAYSQAINIIKDRFGDEFKAAQDFRRRIENWKKIHNDPKALQDFADFLQQCNAAMTVSPYLNVLNDPHENQRILEKLPFRIVSKWAKIVDDWLYEKPGKNQREREFPPFKEFCKFLSREARMANNPVTSHVFKTKDDNKSTRTNVNVTNSNKSYLRKSAFTTSLKDESTEKDTTENQHKEYKRSCTYCKDHGHNINNCTKFLSINLKERKDFIKSENLCWACLYRGHKSADCRVRKRCDKCHGPHPTSIHDDNYKPERKEETKVKDLNVHTCKAGTSSSSSYSLILPVWLYPENRKESKILTYGLLDDQSDGSFIKTSIANRLNVKGHEVNLSLSTIVGNMQVQSQKINGLKLHGFNEHKEISLPSLYTRDDIPANKAQIPRGEILTQYKHLQHLSNEIMPYREDLEVGLLIGTNCIQAIKPIEILPGTANDPYGIKTHLGWGVIGPIKENVKDLKHELYVNKISVNFENLYNMDFIEDKNSKPYSYNDTKFMKRVEDGIELTKGHFQLPLPFKEGEVILPNNREMVLRRLYCQKARLQRDKEFYSAYQQYMSKLLRDEHAERVPNEEVSAENSWYIPHHAVFHPKKPDKLRIVFDCSAKYQNHSLNQCLLQGPDLTNSLIGVLSRFRQETIAIVCDIEGMFHQVKVDPNHRDYIRFVWWKDETLTEVDDYRMSVHLFGATSSPGCANYALKETAKRFESKYGEEAANFVRNNFYVDDGLKSVDTKEKAIKLIQQSKQLCQEGGFRLHKFLSNSTEVIKHVEQEDRAQSIKDIDINKDVLPIERTLGVQWCVESDAFQFRVHLKDSPFTRRGILSTVSSIFDPLGLVSPVILNGKRILQDLCRDGLDWDEAIPEDISRRWQLWRQELVALSQKKIPRCFKTEGFGSIKSAELHTFGDASLIGYGCATYLRLTDEYGTIHCSLVIAKAKVTPLKPITIPRLELVAAVVATKVSKIASTELDYPEIKEYFWSDSTVTLGYINNDARKFHTFVANRVQQIRNYSEPNQWYKIDTLHNVADYCSRGLSASEIIAKDRWWNGPEILWNPIDASKFHLFSPSLQDNDCEVKVLAVKEVDDQYLNLIDRIDYYSTWYRAKRSVAICMQYLQKLRGNKDINSILTVKDLILAERKIIKCQQSVSFKDELEAIKSKEDSTVPRRSTISKLDPFIDTDGILRVGGRIKDSHLPFDVVHPIILPRKSHITDLIIQHYHAIIEHQGRNITHSHIRSSGYWLIGGKSAVSNIISKCTKCTRIRGNFQKQKMADLPVDRLTPAPPFTYSAVDFFGPFYIKERRSEIKRYGVLFTCLSSRAIHLETANSLETDSFLNAYRRFVCRRGPVRHLRSDQGTNFVGAKNELQEELTKMDITKVKGELLKDNCDFIDFIMNTPHSSHMGGVWERLIRTVRSVLASLLSDNSKQLDDESLRTFMTEAETIVNSRPLTEPTDLREPLTPNQLLTLKSQTVLPLPGDFSANDLYSKKRWRRVQHLSNQFWIRWKKEYVQTLQERQKWIYPNRSLRIGDIVIVKNEQMQRNVWPLARVTQVYPDKDNLIRKVTVILSDKHLDNTGKRKVKPTYLDRPIHSLVLLIPCEPGIPTEEP